MIKELTLMACALVAACSSPSGRSAAPGTGGQTMPAASGGAGGQGGQPGSGGDSAGAGGQTTPPAGGQGGQPGNGGDSGGSGSGGSTVDAATDGNGGAPATTDGGGGETGGGCESAPSDDFGGSGLGPCWKLLNGSPADPLISTAVTGGALHLRATGNQNGVWYRTSTKSLVYKELSAANFTVTTTAHPRKASAPTMLPTKDLHVGGVMIRDPASNGGTTENYLFLMVGHSENNNGTVHEGVELKTTVKGCSDYNEPDWGTGATGPDADLRICRIGSAFRLYKRAPGDATWTPATPPPPACPGNSVAGNVLTRTDLPDRLQVGLALNFSAPSDLDVAFDVFTFTPLPATATATDCTAD